MDRYYAEYTSYCSFEATVPRDEQYQLIDPVVDACARERGSVRILELGAGRTGYPAYLRKRNVPLEFDAQDVTPATRDYLREECRNVFIQDVAEISGEYDLVVSTFVFEHVTNPSEFLAHANRLLRIGGHHVIFCPRYDMPGYLCPSLRHLEMPQRQWMMVRLWASRLAMRLDRQPRFWVNCDPSLFHGMQIRDADAVHLVSRRDVEQWHRMNGFEVQRLYPSYQGLRGMLLHRLLTLNLLCRKTG
jgi:SAM-dependent methyltransferase